MYTKKAIEVRNLSKQFRVIKQSNNLFWRLLSFVTGFEPKKNLVVFKDISFSVNKGSVLGIVGKNGCGKTTLFRIISGIYKSTTGTIQTNGNILFLANLSSSLKPRLSVLTNIYLHGSLLGINKKDIEKEIPNILAFSGLEEFKSLKIFQLSSGMKTRLLSSILFYFIPYTKAEILLLDEMLKGGGDLEFRKKSEEKLASFIKQKKTILIISHDLAFINKYCKEVIWIDNKTIRQQGSSKKVLENYAKEYMNQRDVRRYLKQHSPFGEF